jgi:2',3'-cyclic-nucleotide 2'-phosphodiesterase (5'-nucleotidase family)
LPFAVFLLATLLLAACASEQKGPPPVQRLTILHFNDLHGYLQEHKNAEGKTVGGLARMTALINQIRAQNDSYGVATLVLHAGDILTGSALSSAFRGLADIAVLNQMQLDATTVGNHEFDFGRDAFDKLTDESKFPWLVCNLHEKRSASPWLPIGITRRFRGGMTVGIVGVTTPELLTQSRPRNVKDLVVDDPVAPLRAALNRTGRNSLHVVLSHCGLETDKRLAREAPLIDIIIGGHNHTLLEQPLIENGKMIVQAGKYGEHLGRLDLEKTGGVLHLVRYKMYDITPDQPEDSVVKSMVDGYLTQLSEKRKEVLGEAVATLDASDETIRRGETNFGDFTCDAVRERLGVEVVLLNSGGIRASLPKGPILRGDVLQAVPFGDTLHRLTLPGRVIREALDRGVSRNPAENPGEFLQIAGLTYQIDGAHAVNITVAGQPLDENKNYTVAINDFMAEGGDKFDMLKNRPDDVDTGVPLADVLIEAIVQKKRIDAPPDGRIKRIGAWRP